MPQLPIETVISDLLTHVEKSDQIILKAQPGAGKSTYFPLQLIKHKVIKGKIIMLEPRRLAARNIAYFLAKQLGEKVGEQVGFRVKGETKVSSNTKLEIVTEGVMTRMLQSDPELSGVDLLIFDEFHERSIHADTSLAFALEVQEALRDDLKIVVMSATLDQQALQSLLPRAAYIESDGRGFPIHYRYSPLRVNERLIPSVTKAILHAVRNEQGSILVFLPSVGAIKQLALELGTMDEKTEVYPLYGRLTFQQQEQAIAPSPKGHRKIVLATNIAETSLTIEGIRIVIDSGLERVAKFDLRTGVTKLEEAKIAQSSAIQRAGRAGRLEDGICIRLYSEDQFKQFALVPEPEIRHSDLSPLCLELVQWGTTKVDELHWLDTPLTTSLEQGFTLLEKLGLVSDARQLTSLGKSAQKLGIDPRLAAMLVKIRQMNETLLPTALALIPIVEESIQVNVDIAQSLYALKLRKNRSQSVIERRARQLAEKMGTSFSLSCIKEEDAGLCLALAYPDRIAQQRKGQDGQFLLANGHGASIDDLEPLCTNEYVVVVNLMRSWQDTSRVFVGANLNIDELHQFNPSIFDSIECIDWDENKGQLVAEKHLKLGKLIIKKEVLPKPNAEKMTQALLNFVRRKGLSCLNWTPASLALLERMRCASDWFSEKSWPDLTEHGLVEHLEKWIEPFMVGKVSVKSLERIDLSQALLAYIGWPLNKEIDGLLPMYYQVPTGSNKKIIYKAGAEPMVSVRMQEVFGEKTSPLIADGRKRIVLELLSPAHRPLQITSDLAGFWMGSYKEVQKEMKGRYPKHPWPDDPANHIATTKTKRQLKS